MIVGLILYKVVKFTVIYKYKEYLIWIQFIWPLGFLESI